jgi:hypothetical protein
MSVGFNCTPELSEQEPTKESLVDVIEDRPLVRLPNVVDEEWCKRCDEKNEVRRDYGLTEKDGSLLDGHRVRLICGYDPDPNEGQGWVVRAVYHLTHPMKDKEDVAIPEQAQAQVTVELDNTGWTYTQPSFEDDEEVVETHVEDRSVARDVEIEWFSPIGEGEEREPIREPDEHGMIELKPTDPRPNWPEEENEWRKELMQEHDDWNDDTSTTYL